MIYFVQHTETSLVKIGLTHNISDRLYNLQNTYGQVILLGMIAGYYDTERALHRKFKADNVTFPTIVQHDAGVTEWFNPSADLLTFISKKSKLIIPIDLFADSMTYGNIAYHPDGKKPMLASERTDMIAILECPLPPYANIIALQQPALAEGKAA